MWDPRIRAASPRYWWSRCSGLLAAHGWLCQGCWLLRGGAWSLDSLPSSPASLCALMARTLSLCSCCPQIEFADVILLNKVELVSSSFALPRHAPEFAQAICQHGHHLPGCMPCNPRMHCNLPVPLLPALRSQGQQGGDGSHHSPARPAQPPCQGVRKGCGRPLSGLSCCAAQGAHVLHALPHPPGAAHHPLQGVPKGGAGHRQVQPGNGERLRAAATAAAYMQGRPGGLPCLLVVTWPCCTCTPLHAGRAVPWLAEAPEGHG